jgi:hypothetical protein
MISSGIGYIGYINYSVVIFIVSGLLLLYFDVTGYGIQEMKKEQKVARILGWVNVSLGSLMFIGNWFFQRLLH